MKKLIAVLVCATVLVGSMATVSFAANEQSSEVECAKTDNGFRLFRAAKAKIVLEKVSEFREEEHPVMENIKEVSASNRAVRKENLSLAKELAKLLKEAKDNNVTLNSETQAKIDEAKATLEEKKEELKAKFVEKKENHERGDLRAKIKALRENKEELKQKGENLLEEMNKATSRITERNEELKALIEEIEAQLK